MSFIAALAVMVPFASSHGGTVPNSEPATNGGRLYAAWHDSNISTPLTIQFRNKGVSGTYRSGVTTWLNFWADYQSRLNRAEFSGVSGSPCSQSPPQGLVDVCTIDHNTWNGKYGPTFLHQYDSGWGYHAWRGWSDINTWTGNTTPIQTRICHELGHAFGLHHNYSEPSSSCLYYSGATADTFTQWDVDYLHYIYSFADGGSDPAGCLAGSEGPCGVAPSTTQGPQIPGEAAPTPGELVRASSPLVQLDALTSLERTSEGKPVACLGYPGTRLKGILDYAPDAMGLRADHAEIIVNC